MSDRATRKIHAYEVLSALAKRHAEDVFVPECKDGSTHARSGHLRLDAWVMAKSWSHPCVTGYEIKVSRSDFLSDGKWHLYLGLCNVFYFAAAPGIIQESELPDGVGLMVLQGQGHGSRMITKKKASYREVSIPESLFRYILMCRAKIDREARTSKLEAAKDFLAEKDEKAKLGALVRYETRRLVDDTLRENKNLKEQHEKYEDVRRILGDLGIHHISPWRLENDIKEAVARKRALLPKTLVDSLQRAEDSLKHAREQIAKEVV